MDIDKAKEIVQTLAEGIDPTTGEVLPDNSVCNKGEVVRALYCILNCLDTTKPKRELPKNAGKTWTKEDDEKLKLCLESGMSKEEICTKFERSVGSISSRLARLGLVNN